MVLDVLNSFDEDLNITEKNFITGYYCLRWSLTFANGINTDVLASARLFLQIVWNLSFLLGMAFNSITVIRNFINIRPAVLGLKYMDSRRDRQTDREDVIYISAEWA
jgi:hypothetical protein